jgi:hypothetical protein
MQINGGQNIRKLDLRINQGLSRYLPKLMIEKLVYTNLLVRSYNQCLQIEYWILLFMLPDLFLLFHFRDLKLQVLRKLKFGTLCKVF